jgi:hypothetical protein
VSTLAAEIRALVTGARTVVGVVKRVDSSTSLQARFDEAVQEVHREVGQVSYAFCKAIVAHALGHEPSDDEVGAFMTAAVNDQAFPHRAYRLLGEARRSADRRRRQFLAAMLFGLSFKVLPDDERDRVDMAVERMMPADAELLQLVAEKQKLPTKNIRGHFGSATGRCKVLALLREQEFRVATSNDHEEGGAFGDAVFAHDSYRADRVALSSLQALGCLDLDRGDASFGTWQIHVVTITSLGALVLRAIDEVRAGLSTEA